MMSPRLLMIALALTFSACATSTEDAERSAESADARGRRLDFAPDDPDKLYVWHGPPLTRPAAEILDLFASPRAADWAEARRIIQGHQQRCVAQEQEYQHKGFTVELRRRFPPAVFELAARAEQEASARSALVEWGAVIRDALELRNSDDAVAFERRMQAMARSEMGRDLLLGTLIQIINERPDPRLQALAVGGLASYLETLQQEGRTELLRREVKSLIVLMHRGDLGLDSITMRRLAGVLALVSQSSLPWLIKAVAGSEDPVFLQHGLQALGAIGDAGACAVVVDRLERVDLHGAAHQYLVAARTLDALAAIGEHTRLHAPAEGAATAIAPELARRVYRWLAAQSEDEVELRKRGLIALQNLTGQPQRRTLEEWRNF